jgi:hypothetical protein
MEAAHMTSPLLHVLVWTFLSLPYSDLAVSEIHPVHVGWMYSHAPYAPHKIAIDPTQKNLNEHASACLDRKPILGHVGMVSCPMHTRTNTKRQHSCRLDKNLS